MQGRAAHVTDGAWGEPADTFLRFCDNNRSKLTAAASWEKFVNKGRSQCTATSHASTRQKLNLITRAVSPERGIPEFARNCHPSQFLPRPQMPTSDGKITRDGSGTGLRGSTRLRLSLKLHEWLANEKPQRRRGPTGKAYR